MVSKEKVKAAEVQLKLRTITAPFDGIIAETIVKQDSWAKEGDKTMKLVAMDELRVEGFAREGLEKVAPHTLLGSPVTIEVLVASEMPPVIIESTIGFVSPIVDIGQGPKVWAKIRNQKVDGKWILSEGMTATMKIKVGAPNIAQPVTAN